MTWNWQQPDWPRFTWNADRLRNAEERFLREAGVFEGVVRHLPSADRDLLTVEAMSEEAVTTSEIEGERLDRPSVQSSIRRELGLADDPLPARPAERGIAELMVDVYRNWSAPLDHTTLHAWHRMVMRGHADVRDVGRYRTHEDPMRVVSGRLDRPTVHFEAPPSAVVPDEMSAFIDWFNRTDPGGSLRLPALTRAGLAHLYFESIHPFEDGNGRIGRAISEKSLAQSVGRPTLTAMAATILVRRAAYYDALQAANTSNEVTEWLAWFAGITLEAQLRTRAHVEFLLEKTRMLDRLRGRLNDRQEKALLRMFREGPEGFRGGMSAGKYIAITRTSPATARRDLGDLVAMNALNRHGERRHARYELAVSPRKTPRVSIGPDGDIVEHAGE